MRRLGPSSQAGQSLLQLMIVVAIMGILGIVVARLADRVTIAWHTGRLSALLSMDGQAAKRHLVGGLREASVSSLSFGRRGSGQPAFSQVAWVDASGLSRTVYQQGKKLYAADWSGSTGNVTRAAEVIRDGLERFHVFCPDPKDPARVSFSLVLSKAPARSKMAPVQISTVGDVELKHP